MREQKVIYDFGANNGDDIPYYLMKSDKTVSVEANPILASEITRRFAKEILDGRLIVENCVLSTETEECEVSFYICKHNHVLSQFPRPESSLINSFDEVRLPSKNLLNLIKRHGYPFYIKCDLEGYDQTVLKELFINGIRPKFISAEAHSIETFCLLLSLGNYTAFNLVRGASVSHEYSEHLISTNSGKKKYSFPLHSAGPFGVDINKPWMTAENFLKFLVFEPSSWKDIHATNDISPDLEHKIKFINLAYQDLSQRMKNVVRHRAPSIYNRLQALKPSLS